MCFQHQIIKDIVLSSNYKSITKLSKDPRWTWSLMILSRSLEEYRTQKDIGQNKDQKAPLDRVKIAIMGPYLEKSYKLGLNYQFIKEITGFFTNEQEVQDWTYNIFGNIGDPLIHFKNHSYNAKYYSDKFGVVIN